MSLTRAPAQEPQSFSPGLTAPLLAEQIGQDGRVATQGGFGNAFLAQLMGLNQRVIEPGEAWLDELADQAAAPFSGVPVVGEAAGALAGQLKDRTELGVGFTRGALDMATGLASLAADPGAALQATITLVEHTPGAQSLLRGVGGLAAWADGKGTLAQAAVAAFDHGQSWDKLSGFWSKVGGAMAKPYLEALDHGRPYEALGRAGFEVASTIATGGTGLKGLGWVDEAVEGACAARSGLGVANNAGTTVAAANRLTRVDLDALMNIVSEPMERYFGKGTFDPDAFAKAIQLRDAAAHEAAVARQLLGQNPGLDPAEAARMASSYPAYENKGRVYMSDAVHPYLAHEVLQHEAIHTVAAAGWRSPVARPANEGVTQLITSEILNRGSSAYAEHVGVIQKVVDAVGLDTVIEQFLRGTPDALWDLAEQATPGLGRRVPQELVEAQEALLQGQRARVAAGGTP